MNEEHSSIEYCRNLLLGFESKNLATQNFIQYFGYQILHDVQVRRCFYLQNSIPFQKLNSLNVKIETLIFKLKFRNNRWRCVLTESQHWKPDMAVIVFKE